MNDYVKWAKTFILAEKKDLEAEFYFEPNDSQEVKDFRAGVLFGMKYLMVRLERFDKDKVVKPQNNA